MSSRTATRLAPDPDCACERDTQPAALTPSGSVVLPSVRLIHTSVPAAFSSLAPFGYPPIAAAKAASNLNRPPADCHFWMAVMMLSRPLKSLPAGGTPPAASGRKHSGGNPSVNDAAPSTMPICDVSGIGRFNPVSANGIEILLGWSMDCIFTPVERKVRRYQTARRSPR